MRKIRSLVLACLAASIVGCGGGGGDSGSSSVGGGTPPPTTPPTPPPPSGALGSVTLSWTAPSQNTDGSALTDLAGYEIRYGQNMNSLDSTLTISGVGQMDTVIQNLTAGTWYFTVAARNSQGVVSNPSVPASKVIS